MSKTTNIYRELERVREKARHDEATALKAARMKGITDGKDEKASEIASNLIKLGMPSMQIAEITGLPLDKVERLHSYK